MRVARWVRIGMGMSAAWIAGVAIAVVYADARIARLLRYAAFEVCNYVNRHLSLWENCWRELMDFASFVDQPVINIGLIAIVPIAMAWACVCAAVVIYRAVGSSSGSTTQRCG